jgi:hypothetical protein
MDGVSEDKNNSAGNQTPAFQPLASYVTEIAVRNTYANISHVTFIM